MRRNLYATLPNYPARVVDREVSGTERWSYVSLKVVDAELAVSRGPTTAKGTPAPESKSCTERDGRVTVEREANLPLLRTVGVGWRDCREE